MLGGYGVQTYFPFLLSRKLEFYTLRRLTGICVSGLEPRAW
jgi:hypothetical protein